MLKRRAFLSLSLLFLFGGLMRAWPCDSTVRGQAFVDPRDVHRLCVVADGNNPEGQKQAARLEKWLAGPGSEFNAAVVRLDASDENVNWPDYGIPSAPPDLPVVMLAGYDRANRRGFVIAHWEPGPTDEDLENLRSSPVREAVAHDIGDRWAVLLFSPAADGATSKTQRAIEAITGKWSAEHPPGISVVRLDRSDPRERLLASFCGLDPAGPDWLAITFGRCKLMAPPLEGDEITEAALDQLLSRLIEICSCLRPPSMMGVDIPMSWEAARDESVMSLLPPGDAGTSLTILARPPVEIPSSGRPFLAATLTALGLSAIVVAAGTTAVMRKKQR